MASSSKCLKSCSQNEDRISGLPDALLCHILSCFSTREAVRTSVLSHRWKKVWAYVPNLYFDENDFDDDSDKFVRFVNGVLLHRSPVNINRFRLVTSMMRDVPLLYTWFSTAIRRNVVELDLTIGRDKLGTDKRPFFEIPKKLLLCSTLVRLKLWLRRNIDVKTTRSNCFPCLKFLHVTVSYPDSDSMENLFSRFPVLEDLIIDGVLEDRAAFKLDISAPKLKRLQIKLDVIQFAIILPEFAPRNFGNYKCKIFMNVDAPNLEELDICFDVLLSFSLRNAKRLRKAKIDFFHVEQLKNHDRYLGLADRIRQTFAGICDAKYLTVGAPISAVLDIGYQRLLPTFNNVNHLELQLQTCRDLQSLATLLKVSPNLEHLKISVTKHEYAKNSKYCDDDNEDVVLHEWDAPEFAHISLISHLKTVCLWDFKGCPNDMEVAKYLVKHGKSLNKVTIHTRSSENKDMKSQSPTALSSQFSKFPWGSKTCEIEYCTIV